MTIEITFVLFNLFVFLLEILTEQLCYNYNKTFLFRDPIFYSTIKNKNQISNFVNLNFTKLLEVKFLI